MLFNNNNDNNENKQSQASSGDPPIFLPDSVSASRIRQSQEVIQHYFDANNNNNQNENADNDDNKNTSERNTELESFRKFQQEESDRLLQEQKQKFTCSYAEYATCKECHSMCYDHPTIAFQRKDTRAFSTSVFLEYFHADCFIERYLKKDSSLVTSIEQFEGLSDLSQTDRSHVEESIRKFLGQVKNNKNDDEEKEQNQEVKIVKEEIAEIEEKETTESSHVEEEKKQETSASNENENETKTESSTDESFLIKKRNWEQSTTNASNNNHDHDDNEQQQNQDDGEIKKYSLPHMIQIPEESTQESQNKNKVSDFPPTSAAFLKLLIIPQNEDSFKFPFLHLLNPPYQATIKSTTTSSAETKEKTTTAKNNKKKQTEIVSPPPKFITTLEEAVDEFLSQTACLQIMTGPLITNINPVQYAAGLGNLPFFRKVYDTILEKTKDDAELQTKLINKIFRDTVASHNRSLSEFVGRSGCAELIKFFHSKKLFTPDILNENQGTPVFVFIQGHDDVETLKFLHHEAGSVLEGFRSSQGENYLHLAIRKNRKNIVKYLIENSKIDINAKFKEETYWASPFALAAKYCEDDEIIRILYKHGGGKMCLDEMKASVESMGESLAATTTTNGSGGSGTGGGGTFGAISKFKTQKVRTLKLDEKIDDLLAATNKNDPAAASVDSTSGNSASVTIVFVKPRYFPVIPISDALKLEQVDQRRQQLEAEKEIKRLQTAELVESTKNNNHNALILPTMTETNNNNNNNKQRLQEQADKLLPFIDPKRRYIIQGHIKRFKPECPLHLAVENAKGGLAITKFLCEEAGFDSDKNRHCATSTPVYLAAKSNHVEILRYLVEERGADATASDSEGCTACYVSAYYNFHECIRILLKNGANSSIMYKNLMTPAVAAASSDALEAMMALAEGGGDVSTPFGGSSNVIDYARQRGNDRIAEYLINFGAK